MIRTNRMRWLGLAFALLGFLLLAAGAAFAQTTTGTIRGYVKDQNGAPLPGAEIQARNVETGVVRTTSSRTDGAYFIPGLAPGTYAVGARHIGHAPQSLQVIVQVGATVLADFALVAGAVQLEAVTVEAAAPVVETRTSEVATNVTSQQINNLPTSDRNFLDLASLAPGTTLLGNRINDTRKTFVAGAQEAEQINVFIDGANYKNDILQGGVVGQDASRGNPFPRNAVREFRVITQNFKAEYQDASSAIITATTQAGTNQWRSNAFLGFIDKGLVALDTFQRADKVANPTTFRQPDYTRYQLGVSVGGPLVRDRLHLFASYEGNYQDRTSRVSIVPPTGYAALDTIDFASRNGDFGSPFRETLLFGKLSYARTATSLFELSYNGRFEHDVRDFGGLTAFEAATRFRNSVNTGVLKYNYFKNALLNEATVSYQRYNYNPVPDAPGTANRFYGFGCCAQLGSNISVQDFTQKRLSFRDNLTYSGFEKVGTHVVKVGANVDFVDYDIVKRNSEIPRFVYEPWYPDATQANAFSIPERVEFQAGDPNFGTTNSQVGIFAQDDWSPTPRLTLNLGIRWDYESHMLNYDYVTPQAVVDSLTKYRDSLFLPLDTKRYFTDGTDRPKFTGAFQPRLGASYQLDERGRTTVFGGWGIFYDRTLFDQTIEEKFALQHPSYVLHFRPVGDNTPGRIDWDASYLTDPNAVQQLLQTNPQANRPEVKLLANNLRPPKANQFNVGVRQLIGSVAVQAAYTGVRSFNRFTFYWANSNFVCPERSFGVAGCFVTHQIPGYSTILFATNAGKTWYDALQVRVDRPYQRMGRIGWGAGIAYTYAKRQTAEYNDNFSFPNPVDYPKQVRNDERHHAVANWIVDVPWVWGAQFGGLLTVGSGTKLDVGDRFGGTTNPLKPGGFDPPTFWNLDLRLRKDFPLVSGQSVGVTADLFNALNRQNLGCYNVFNPSDPNFGKAGCVLSDPRRLQVGAEYSF